MLITLLCLIGLVVLAMVAVRVFGQDTQARGQNRYKRKRSRRKEPVLSTDSIHSVEVTHNSEDSDAILGLKEAHEQSYAAEPAPKAKSTAPKVVAFYLVAPADQEFVGYELLQAILSVGFRYGDMQIFHRHEERSGKGPILFSLSSISEPGTFDMANIGGFSCRGLTLFMQYDRITDPVYALDLMVEAAEGLVEELGGRLLAGDRQPLDQATIAHYREQIEQFVLQHTDQM